MGYTPRDPAVTSRVMAAIRGRDNRTEVALRKALHARGLRYRLHSATVVGRPDILFPTERVAVFVDGDYWHGRVLREQGLEGFYARFRTERREFWLAKLSRNIARDDHVTRTLRGQGWLVLRYWESEVAADVAKYARRVEAAVRRRRARGPGGRAGGRARRVSPAAPRGSP